MEIVHLPVLQVTMGITDITGIMIMVVAITEILAVVVMVAADVGVIDNSLALIDYLKYQ